VQFPPDSHRDVIQRLRRLEGQIRGLQRMLEEGAECRDIVTQLAAAKGALDRVGFKLMSSALRECAVDESADADELERLFLKLS
jgi:DNA-binding FrmR family transcriptional regulator